MRELVFKKEFISYLTKDFKILEGMKGTHFFGNTVRPDIMMQLKYSDVLIAVELKNDRAKNYNANHHLRQAINYKYSKYDGKIPDFVFVSTPGLMAGEGLAGSNMHAVGLAAKLGVGIIRMNRRSQMTFNIGSKKFYFKDFNTGDSNFQFYPYPLTVGTKAKSNRTEIE